MQRPHPHDDIIAVVELGSPVLVHASYVAAIVHYVACEGEGVLVEGLGNRLGVLAIATVLLAFLIRCSCRYYSTRAMGDSYELPDEYHRHITTWRHSKKNQLAKEVELVR